MMSSVLTFFSAFLVGLLVASGVAFRRRLRERIGRSGPRVDDAAVREILQHGHLSFETDEPLDPGRIEEEERRFWAESWDEPEEW